MRSPVETAGDAPPETADGALAEAALGAPAGFYRFRLSPSGAPEIPLASPDFLARFGLAPGRPEETAASLFSLIHPDDLPRINDAISRSAQTLEAFECDFRARLASGLEAWIEARSNPRRMPDGRLVWDGIVTDVTGRRRAEEALQASEKRYHGLFAENPQPMWFFDTETLAFLEVNDAAVAHYGYSRDEFLSMTIADIRPSEDVPRMREAVGRVRGPGIDEAGPWRHRKKDGSIIQVEITAHESSFAGRPAEIVLANDITERIRAGEEMRRQEMLLRVAGDSVHLGGWGLDPVTMKVTWTEETARIHDLDPSEPIDAASALKYYTDESRPRVEAAVREALAGGTPYDLEAEIVTAKGCRKSIRTIGQPVVTGGKVVHIRGSFQDISGLKRAEAALRESEERFRAMFEVSPVGMAQADPATGRWLAVNPRMCLITGYTADELLGMRVPELTHPEDRGRDWDLFQKVVRGEAPEYRIEKRYVRKDGSIAWVSVNMVVLRDAAGTPTRTLGLIEDITARKAAETDILRLNAELRDALDWQRQIFEGSRDAVFLSDEESRFVAVNRAAEELTGYSRDELLGMRIPDLHEGPDTAAYRMFSRRIFEGEKILSEAPVLRKDGRKVDVEFNNSLVVIGGSRFMHTAGRDVTERRRATRRLALQAELGRVLAESASLAEAIPRILQAVGESEGMTFGAWWEPASDRLLRCSHTWSADPGRCSALEAASRGLRISPGEGIPGRTWAARHALHVPDLRSGTVSPRAPAAATAGLRSAVGFPVLLRGEPVSVIEFFAPEIREIDPAFAGSVEMLGGQIGLYLERERAQEESARYVAGSPAVLYAMRLTDAVLTVTWFSDNLQAMTGYSHAEVAADAAGWWQAGIHPEDRARVLEASRSAAERNASSIEYRFRRKNGTWFWLRDEKRVLRDATGQPTEIVGSWLDVTDRVRLEEQLRQSQKMEAIGQLAGGVAHDFNNLLTVISGNCELLLSGPPPDAMRGPLTDIRAAGDRAASLTRQLLAFSRKQILEPRFVDVHVVIADMERMLRRLIGENIDLVTDLAADPGWAKVDPGQLEQVLVNLAVNARDAMPRGGRITIRTRIQDPVADPEATASRLRPRLAISVSDTGTGIAPEARTRLFEPFFTTKAVGKGTGLGLATVYGIVKQSGGDITVDCAPGEGATFTVLLPSHAAPRQRGSVASFQGVPHGAETILAVEDEDAVRRIVRIALESTGYRVIEARSGPEALELASRHAGRIDLLLTDVVMPEMSGRELAERIAKVKPGIRVLCMSGYTDEAIAGHGIAESGVAFLQKPFSPLTLARKVRDVLDARASSPARRRTPSGT